jgi:dethiobiotin synthetase
MQKKYFVSGIGTDIGKTVISAILCEALKASYWKPIQAGDLQNTDANKVTNLCPSNIEIIPEVFKLKTPASPHFASKIDEISINLNDFTLPQTNNNLIIEGAGGLMVPINSSGDLIIDLIKQLNTPVILVSRHYLGSINHTLLSLELLKQKQIQVEILIFVGEKNDATESIIKLKFSDIKTHRIGFSNLINASFVEREAKKIIGII